MDGRTVGNGAAPDSVKRGAGSLVVGEEGSGQRLDLLVLQALPDAEGGSPSRTAVQRAIEAGAVLVDGRQRPCGYRVRPGERITWLMPGAPAAEPPEEEQPQQLRVLHEDEDLLVVDKPAGLVVHPGPGHSHGTLAQAVAAHVGAGIHQVGAAGRPGIVHRLDRDTSGVLVVAKTEHALRKLQAQLAARTMGRSYVVLVVGNPRWDRAEVDAPIGRHPVERKRMAVIPEGSRHTHRSARTEFQVLERCHGLTLLEARLHSGRTHQVRVHCAYMHLPVAGDPVYGSRGAEAAAPLPLAAREALAALPGQALHAYRLELVHPRTGARMTFQAALPGPLEQLLQAVGCGWRPPASIPT